jgi:hypothetical protein
MLYSLGKALTTNQIDFFYSIKFEINKKKFYMIKTIVLVDKDFNKKISENMEVPLYDHFSDSLKTVSIQRDLTENIKETPKVIKELETEEEEFDKIEGKTTTKGNIFGIQHIAQEIGSDGVDSSNHSNKGNNHIHQTNKTTQNYAMLEGTKIILNESNKDFINKMKKLQRYHLDNLELLLFYGGEKDVRINAKKTIIDFYNLQVRLNTFKKILNESKNQPQPQVTQSNSQSQTSANVVYNK